MQHTAYSYHFDKNPNFADPRVYYQLLRHFWAQKRATFHNSVTVKGSGLRAFSDLVVREDKFRKYEVLPSRFLGPFTLVPCEYAISGDYVDRLNSFAAYLEPVFGPSELICVSNSELQSILGRAFFAFEGNKIPVNLYNPSAGELASFYSACANKIVLRNLLTYFWANHPELGSKSYPFVPHFYRLGKELKPWVQKKVGALSQKFKCGNQIPDKGDGLILQMARAERGTRTLVLRVVFCGLTHKYFFELGAKGKPQKFELDQTAEVTQAVMQNLKEDQPYLAMSHIGEHAALSIGVYFDGSDFYFGEPRVQLVSARAGFQGAAFGANIGLPEGYFYGECRDRVKQFCSEFLVHFFRYLYLEQKHTFPAVFGVDFLAKRSKEGGDDLRLYISEVNLRFTAVSTTERLIATLNLDDLVASGYLAVLQLEHCFAPYIDSEFEVHTFYEKVAELLQQRIDPIKVEVLPVILRDCCQRPATSAQALILEAVRANTVLIHPLSLPNLSGKFSLIVIGTNQDLESLMARLRKNSENWVVDLRSTN